MFWWTAWVFVFFFVFFCNKWSEFIFRIGPVVKGLRIRIKDTIQLQCPRSAFVREGEERKGDQHWYWGNNRRHWRKRRKGREMNPCEKCLHLTCESMRERESRDRREGVHTSSTWPRTSAPLTCYPDRLKTLKVGGSKSEGDGGRKRREEGGEREGCERGTGWLSQEKGEVFVKKKGEGKEGEERKRRGYMWLFEVAVQLWSETE